MARHKNLVSRLTSSKVYKELGSPQLTEEAAKLLIMFDEDIGYNHDRVSFIVWQIIIDCKNWVETWSKLKTLKQSSLEYYQCYFGEVEGLSRYIQHNKNKNILSVDFYTSKGFTETEAKQRISTLQKNNAIKSSIAAKSKPHDERTCRQIGFWMAKGYTNKQAIDKVGKIQTTNGIEYYRTKYSIEEAGNIQEERNHRWQTTLNTNPINQNIGFRRGHSLERYIQRANGDSTAGFSAYKDYWKKLDRFHKASKESLVKLSPVIDFCTNNKIQIYSGVEGSHEWIIHDDESKKIYRYDFTIPLLGAMFEYHGETWHPNPKWETDEWNKWKKPHVDTTADQAYLKDTHKSAVAIKNGWDLKIIYSSDDPSVVIDAVSELNARLTAINNSHFI